MLLKRTTPQIGTKTISLSRTNVIVLRCLLVMSA